MSRTSVIAWSLTVLLTASAVPAAPPARPLPLTANQYNHLRAVEQQPQHTAIQGIRASYTSDRERSLELSRLSDDITTGAWNVGFPTIIVILLIAAAPL